jgi:transposase InsO family protein
MPWKVKTVETSRLEFIQKVLSEGNKSKISKENNISRTTCYKWLKRYNEKQIVSDQSRRPLHSPNKTPDEIEKKILDTRTEHQAWGARKIKRFLEDKGEMDLPAASTISDILKRNNLISKENHLSHIPHIRFARAQPNELWQADFKGDFALADNTRCFPLTVLDDHSRFSLCIDAKTNQKGAGVFESFKRLFEEYGLPDSILTDNGNPWGTSQRTGYTLFEIWLMELDIFPVHGRFMHPETQGKEERFHRTMKAEILKRNILENQSHAQKIFDEWRHEYNYERPHEALNLDTPSKHYRLSKRKPTKIISELEFYNEANTRKVNPKGYISYQNHMYFLSEAFAGKYIEISESEKPHHVNLNFRNYRIAKINLEEQLFISKTLKILTPDRLHSAPRP